MYPTLKEGKTCKICGKIFTRRNYMQKHMEHIHSKRYSCPKCFRFFSGPTEHSCAVENGRFSCYVRDCSLRFSNGMSMRLHIRDCHRKVDEEVVVEEVKTKKGVRELVQTLCKKINLLSNCFDELKYQVDTIASFLQSKDFGFENTTSVMGKSVIPNEREVETILEGECKEEYEDVDYIDEEFIDEDISEMIELQDEDSMITDDSEQVVPVSIRAASNKESFILTPSSPSNVPLASTVSQLNSPTALETKKILNSTSTVPINFLCVKTSEANVKKHSSATSGSQTTTIGSTIITQIPTRLINQQSSTVSQTPASTSVTTSTNSIRTRRKPTSTIAKSTKNDSPTPPLFLKIQYDPETTVCETDPKITFHFDTKPPDEVHEEFI